MMIQTIKDLVAAKADTTVQLARDIWSYAELSYEETRSAAALINALKQEGFAKALSVWAGSLALSILVGKLASLLLIS